MNPINLAQAWSHSACCTGRGQYFSVALGCT